MAQSPRTPVIAVRLADVQDPAVQEVMRQVFADIDRVRAFISAAIPTYVSQNAAPVPDEGQTYIWKDADAGAGQPKAYIVTKRDGVTYTFRSVEVV